MTTTTAPLDVLQQVVPQAEWLAALDELSHLRFVGSDETNRISVAIRTCFPDGLVSVAEVESNILFERSLGDGTYLGAEFDADELLKRLRALVPERVLRDFRWRMFALVIVGHAFRVDAISDANLALIVLIVLALAPGAADAPMPAIPTSAPLAQERLAPLFWLLRDLFTSDELKIFARFYQKGGDEFVAALPDPDIGRANYAFEVLEALQRWGWIDEAFFSELARQRPNQAKVIASVQARVLGRDAPLP